MTATAVGISPETKIKADELKVKGNEALKLFHYEDAISFYTKAIDLDSNNAIYFANRGLAYLKNESYGAAIQDFTSSVTADPSYTKAYYRRGVAWAAISRHSNAITDFKTFLKTSPNDAFAKQNLSTCQKIVRAQAFAKAIEVSDAPSVIESVNLNSMTVEDSYTGVPLEITVDDDTKTDDKEEEEESYSNKKPDSAAMKKVKSILSKVHVKVTQEFITSMISLFKDGKQIPRKYLFAIILGAMKHFVSEPSLVEIDVTKRTQQDPKTKVTVCGDTHGQFYDLLNIFKLNGFPSESNVYLFNGDFVDRGSWSTEIAILFFAYKCLYPNSFFLNRGNHESDAMNKMYGFEGECKAKYKTDLVYSLFTEAFAYLPLATVIEQKHLVLHGGLFSKDGVTLEDIKNIDRFAQKQPGNTGIMMELLWSDPQPELGRSAPKRGVGVQFGPDVTKRFCDDNGLKTVIRSHEVRQQGYEMEHDGYLCTVFSAPNYCDTQGNEGAYINIAAPDCDLKFNRFSAVPHPNIKPMAYSSRMMF